MDDTVLVNSLKNAVEQLYKKDAYLLRSSHELHEQTVSHRLAVYLENNLRKISNFKKKNFSVDCEYNKNGKEPKKIYSSCYNCQKRCFIKSLKRHNPFEVMFDDENNVRPDIIVHKRGENFPTNLLIVELKKKTNRNADEKERDKMKLSAFTCPVSKEKNHYQYQLGFFIEFNGKKASLQEFKDGKETTVYSFNAETKEWAN